MKFVDKEYQHKSLYMDYKECEISKKRVNQDIYIKRKSFNEYLFESKTLKSHKKTNENIIHCIQNH